MKSETVGAKYIPVILYVEDNEDHAELFARGVENSGIAVKMIRAPDGEVARDLLLDESRALPGLILLDLRLPRLDGLTLLEQIKTNPRTMYVPVLILTSSSSEADIHRAYSGHANSYLVKPMDFALLSRLIKGMLSYWLQWNIQPGTPHSSS